MTQEFGQWFKQEALTDQLDQQIGLEYTAHPFFNYCKRLRFLREQHYWVNTKRIACLIRMMGFQAMVLGPNTSRAAPQNPIYPYLLRGLKIEWINQVWNCDITYIPMPGGFVYLFAVIDWYSLSILAWKVWAGLSAYFPFYKEQNACLNSQRPHQSLDYQIAALLYYGG